MSVEIVSSASALDVIDERKTVELAQTGNKTALSDLYMAYQPRVFRYALARTGNVHDSEDLVAETFARAIEAISGFEDRGIPFSAWLFRIAHNLYVDARRRQKPHLFLEDTLEDQTYDVEELVEQRALLSQVVQAMDLLTYDQKSVLSLRFGGGLSMPETACVLGESEGVVKSRQHRAILKLREIMGVPQTNGKGQNGKLESSRG